MATGNIVAAFGRLNPPTLGHAKLIQHLISVAKAKSGKVVLFISHSQDSQKNPLSYSEKVQLVRTAFPGITIGPADINGPVNVLDWAKASGAANVTLAVGADRLDKFTSLAKSWMAYNPNSTKVTVSEIPRFQAISATDARNLALKGDIKGFKRIVMPGLSDAQITDVVKKIKDRLHEMTDYTEFTLIVEADGKVLTEKDKDAVIADLTARLATLEKTVNDGKKDPDEDEIVIDDPDEEDTTSKDTPKDKKDAPADDAKKPSPKADDSKDSKPNPFEKKDGPSKDSGDKKSAPPEKKSGKSESPAPEKKDAPEKAPEESKFPPLAGGKKEEAAGEKKANPFEKKDGGESGDKSEKKNPFEKGPKDDIEVDEPGDEEGDEGGDGEESSDENPFGKKDEDGEDSVEVDGPLDEDGGVDEDGNPIDDEDIVDEADRTDSDIEGNDSKIALHPPQRLKDTMGQRYRLQMPDEDEAKPESGDKPSWENKNFKGEDEEDPEEDGEDGLDDPDIELSDEDEEGAQDGEESDDSEAEIDVDAPEDDDDEKIPIRKNSKNSQTKDEKNPDQEDSKSSRDKKKKPKGQAPVVY